MKGRGVSGPGIARPILAYGESLGQDRGTHFTLTIPPSSGELFRPTCPKCSRLCDHDSLWCCECGARLYTIESGRYGKRT